MIGLLIETSLSISTISSFYSYKIDGMMDVYINRQERAYMFQNGLDYIDDDNKYVRFIYDKDDKDDKNHKIYISIIKTCLNYFIQLGEPILYKKVLFLYLFIL